MRTSCRSLSPTFVVRDRAAKTAYFALARIADPSAISLFPSPTQVYEQYEEGLANAQALDFDDILLRALQLFKKHGDRVLANVQRMSL